MGFLSTLFGYGQSNTKKEESNKLKEIEVKYNEEDGFKDVNLTIVSEEKTNHRHIFVAKGLHNGKVVGLRFEIVSEMPAGLDENGLTGDGFLKNVLEIKSIGDESDAFLKGLSELYGFPANAKFKNTISVPTLFSLNKENVNLDKPGFYHFKAFFEENNDDDYCEIFFNIDSFKRVIELHEKDEEYRKQIIKAFSQFNP